MDAPGPLLGVGRAADVYDLGGGRVLRRYRTEHDAEPEATVMRAAGEAGVPVPEVFDVDGGDLVMARIDGPTMLDDLAGAPWRLRAHARTLAELHRRVADVDVDGLGLATLGDPPSATRLCHGDLHPENVLMTGDGPVVIDWTNARRAAPHVDAALTWLVLVAADSPGSAVSRLVATVGRRAFVAAFRAEYGGDAIDRRAGIALDARLADTGLTETEKDRMRAAVHPAGGAR